MASAIKFELYMLARGHVREAKRFIDDREQRFKLNHPKISRRAREMVREIVRLNPHVQPHLRSWEGFRAAMQPLWDWHVLEATGPLPKGIVQSVFTRPADFPVLNTWLNSQLHLQFLAWNEKELPGQSRVDDYRIIIESNAADLFVTDDDRLFRRFSTINPFRRVIAWRNFLTDLEAGGSNRTSSNAFRRSIPRL